MPIVNCEFCGRDTNSKSGLCVACDRGSGPLSKKHPHAIIVDEDGNTYEYGDRLPPGGRERDIAEEVRDTIDDLLF